MIQIFLAQIAIDAIGSIQSSKLKKFWILNLEFWILNFELIVYFCIVLKITFNKVITFPLVVLIKIYQWFISPLMPKNCRYEPTCSHYMMEALQIHGIFKGFYLGVKRILRCHPWGGEGYDPVPPKWVGVLVSCWVLSIWVYERNCRNFM